LNYPEQIPVGDLGGLLGRSLILGLDHPSSVTGHTYTPPAPASPKATSPGWMRVGFYGERIF